jgi:glutaminyl-tRNA synthetase
VDTTKGEGGLESSGEEGRRSNFIRDIIDADIAQGTHAGKVVTRFPPEPNGYLHLGHAKSMCVNFGIARDYQGVCNLRFDDTNPTKEDAEFVHSIREDVAWFGFDLNERVVHASDYFERMHAAAVRLIERGKAFVCDLDASAIREHRGSLREPGTESPFRNRGVAENLALFADMRAGKFAEGACVLRAKIDMEAANILMRDPVLYRIVHASHHRQGDAWCIYPMYDFAHCLEDSFEGVTHSLCTLEFENNRELYDWVIRESEVPWVPQQIEFARLNLGYTVLSKRKLLQLVTEGHVKGWDDPRMPTIAGLRRRGVTPEALIRFCDMIGVAKANSLVDMEKLEFCIRDELNHQAPRAFSVLRPLKVTLTSYPEDTVEWIEAPLFPEDVGKPGVRKLPFSRTLFIEADDFREEAPRGWHRLAPGAEVRLLQAYCIRCEEVVRDPATGEVIELLCTHDPETRGRKPEGRRVKGSIHWLSAEHAVACEVRLYDRLFQTERPDGDPDVHFLEHVNPDSLVTLSDALVEPGVSDAGQGDRFQFVRQGYFAVDSDSTPERQVFNRVVALRDSWARKESVPEPSVEKPKASAPPTEGATRERPKKRSREHDRARTREGNPALAAAQARLLTLGVAEADADRLTGSQELVDLHDAAVAGGGSPSSVATWVLNEAVREFNERGVSPSALDGAALGRLVALVDSGDVSSTGGKEVLRILLEDGGDPAEIVAARGLTQVSDVAALAPVIAEVLAANEEAVLRYRDGKKQLLGFFIGAVMRASGGSANPEEVRVLLQSALNEE